MAQATLWDHDGYRSLNCSDLGDRGPLVSTGVDKGARCTPDKRWRYIFDGGSHGVRWKSCKGERLPYLDASERQSLSIRTKPEKI